jgi:hypothetical protein
MRPLSVSTRYTPAVESKIVTISRIKDSSCPLRYFKDYVETPKQKKSFESIETGLGSFFHDVVAKHFDSIRVQGRPIAAADVLDVASVCNGFELAMLWNGAPRPPYRIVKHGQDPADLTVRLEGICGHFNQCIRQQLRGHSIEAIECNLEVETDECFVRGKCDLITRDSSGAFCLWDWKTGNAPKPEYFDDFRTQKLQLGFYATWMRYRYEAADVVAAAVFLRDELVVLTETFREQIESMVLQEAAAWRRRQNSVARHDPIPNNLCAWCGWNPVCPAYGVRTTTWVTKRIERDEPTTGDVRQELPTSRGTGASRCFVATVAFEDADAPEDNLRVLQGWSNAG